MNPTAPAHPWTVEDMPDLTGRVALVTDADSHVGFPVAFELAAAGAHVVLAGPHAARSEAAAERIEAAVRHSSAEVLALDLADLGSVRSAAETFARHHDRLDMMVGCTGPATAAPLGHFALTGLLLEHLRSTAGARVVAVGTVAHRLGPLALAALARPATEAPGGPRPWPTSWPGRLADLPLAFVDRRLRQAEASTLSVAAHPGWTRGDLPPGTPASGSRVLGVAAVARRLVGAAAHVGARTASSGALPVLFAATAPGVVGGALYAPAGPLELSGPPVRARPPRALCRPELAGRLWQRAEERTGVHYGLPAAAATPRRSH